ncbi:hypothetical protein E1B28_009025 [Marasmius oreades]|uniref:Polynucleotide 5'-hydroxyl-kinase GRC3 n=1 Tax=Marasmius oreades TaxID=181124 RepID=A0A9P7RZJ2_9AGAR|nr:uncharacterized protein E1B28_009025 [Marasmius oreades]KAG7092694.1 hypothetical protein E1B28_009025 [Marasmius oreades]
MISAIAARKAAQAKVPAFPQQPAPDPRDSRSSSPTPPKRKRKSDAAIPNPKKKKKSDSSKKPPTSVKKTRYFHEIDPIARQDDIILIESDQEEDDGKEDLVVRTSARGRAWSPSAPAMDITDDEQDHETLLPGPEEPQVISTYHPVLNQNLFSLDKEETTSLGLPAASSSKAVLVSLSDGETIALLGTYNVSVLQGSISLLGATVLPCQPCQYHPVFAPRSSPIPVMKAMAISSSNDNSVVGGGKGLKQFRHAFREGNVVISIQELRTNVEGLGKVCRLFDGVFQPPPSSLPFPNLGLHGLHLVVSETKGIHAFVQPSDWDPVFTLCELEHVLLVKGAKKSGKSTFARTLVNHLLGRHKKVAYLECDLGQSEFTPGGMVAINVIERPVFGPPFTHPTLPNHAHYLGTLTPRSSPSHYLSAIESIAQTYKLDIKIPVDHPDEKIPLVVNTMGWTKGLGADLTKRIEEIIEPDAVFEFETDGKGTDGGWLTERPRQDSTPFTGAKYNVHPLRPIDMGTIETATAYFSAADHRVISLLSYFHAVFPTSPSPPSPPSLSSSFSDSVSMTMLLKDSLRQITAHTWSTSLPLLAQPPYEVDIQKAIDRVHLVGAGSEDVVKEEIGRVLNGAIVGLVNSEFGISIGFPSSTSSSHSHSHSQDIANGATDVITIPYVQNAPPPDPNTSRAHGLALIRGVSGSPDAKETQTRLHVLTPLPPELLSTARIWVKGEMELPVWGLLDLPNRAGAPEDLTKPKPFLQWGKGEGLGSERRRVRRNLMRKSQV